MRTASLQRRKREYRFRSHRVGWWQWLSCASVRQGLPLILGLAVALALPLSARATAVSDGETWSPDFPRLAMTWPDPHSQPATDIARWDYVSLYDYDRDSVSALRAADPQTVLLTSTNALELPLDSSSWAKPLGVPNDWILTQLGSTLATSVSATATSFPVADTTRFRAGDVLVIEDELSKVTSVDSTAGALLVQRGLNPATHASGVCVAASVVFWPGSVVLNLSGYCPRVTVDAAVGPETWGEYNARRSVGLLGEADWDGIYIDRTSTTLSFVAAPGRPYTRSIDAQRTNVAVTDGYAALDASYLAALLDYQTRIRTAAPDRLIMTNVGAPNYGVVNGTALEFFPRPTWSLDTWIANIIDTSGDPGASGTYADWCASSRSPNLTHLLSYEYDSSPTQGQTFTNPFGTPGWHPNYQRMRYGLCTTLMNDGFFDYEMNTAGHGGLGLMWFDEYDNAGQGKGYLGQPEGAASLVELPPLSSPDLLAGDGAFANSTQLSHWTPWATSGNSISPTLESGTARLAITTTASANTALMYDGVPVTNGSFYTLSFRARASAAMPLGASVAKTTEPYSVYLTFDQAQLGTEWKQYRFTGRATGTDPAARLVLYVGDKAGTVWLDDVKLQSGTPEEVYRRDFARGIALVNPSETTVTVPLGGSYRKIQGTQEPTVNDGALVSAVTLSPKDGLVLLDGPALSLVKTGTYVDYNGDGVYNPGDRVTYAFRVENTGNGTLSNITLADANATLAGGPIATLGADAVNTSTFTGIHTLTQADIDAGSFTNTATVTGTPPSGPNVTGNASDTRALTRTPALSLVKTGTYVDYNGDGRYSAGDRVTYAFRVENTGNVTLTGVTVTDPKATVNGGPVATLAPGAVNTSTFTGIHTLTQADIDAGSFTNTATVTGTPPSGPDATGNASDTRTMTRAPALSLVKTGIYVDYNGDGRYSAGDRVTYAFRVENTGNVTLTGVTVTDPKATVNGGPVATLAPGAVNTSTFTGIHTLTQADIDSGSFTNTATVTGTPLSGPNVTGTDSDTRTLTRMPALSLVKTGTYVDYNSDGVCSLGDRVTYAFRVENTGNVTLTDITLADASATLAGGPIATLAPGAVNTSTFTGTHTLTQADIDAGSFTNTATVTGTPPSGPDVTADSSDTRELISLLTVPANGTINYGKSAVISGTLMSVEGTTLAGRLVVLHESFNGSTWTTAATTTTSIDGSYSFAVKPLSKRYFKTHFPGDASYPQGYSRAMRVRVRPYVRTPIAPKTMRRSRYYTIYGYLKPRHTSGTYPVRIYRYKRTRSGKWKSYGYVKAKARNYRSYTKYYKKLKLTSKGRWRLRAYASADSGHLAKWSSGYDYVTVK